MRRRADRYTLDLPIELFAAGRKLRGLVHDVSRTGMFVELSPVLPIGAKVHVAIRVEDRRVVTTARVTHGLSETDARALGRTAGIGIAFRDPIETADQLFAIAIDRLVRTLRPPRPPAQLHVIVGDPATRLLERMSTELAHAGFAVAVATTGLEVLAACFRRMPDVVLVDRAMALVSGLDVLDTIANDARLSRIPVIATSEHAADIALAFEHGAADFIAKPYTAAEVGARARRLVASSAIVSATRHTPRRASAGTPRERLLSGSLATIRLAGILTMLEQERASGRLALHGPTEARIELVDGRIAGAQIGDGSSPTLATLLTLLDWHEGTFELVPSDGCRSDDDFAMSVIHVLLEHARHSDERVVHARGSQPEIDPRGPSPREVSHSRA